MYSEEIKRLLLIKRNLVTTSEYFEICSSKQVDHVQYNPDTDMINIWTNDGYKFELKIGVILPK